MLDVDAREQLRGRARRPRRARARRSRPRSSRGPPRVDRRCGRSSPPSRIALGIWQLVVWSGWKPGVRPARRRQGVPRAVGHDRRRQAAGRRRQLTMQPRGHGLRSSRSSIGVRRRHRSSRRRTILRVGVRLVHHRPADHAVDRVVPARDPRSSSCPRRAIMFVVVHRRGAVDRQRPHLRHRPRAAAVRARRARARRRPARTCSGTSSSRRRCPRRSAG